MEMGSRLDRITDWEARARMGKYRVGNLAKSVRVSCRQLERYFLRKIQARPKAWLDDLKMVDAARLWRRGLRVKDIATNAGFKNPTHFSRAFKRRYGRNLRSSAGTESSCLPDVANRSQMSQKGP
jgi:transcriptional regulator GlxA family with amidase domain